MSRNLTEENRIYNLAIQAGIPKNIAPLVVAQARHESGEFTSHFYTVNHNAFGYSRSAGSKWQSGGSATNADNGVPVGNYTSVANSVNELRDWWLRRMSANNFSWRDIASPETYGHRLKMYGYFGATETSYVAALKTYFSQAAQFLEANPGTSMATVVGLLFFFTC